MLAISGGLLFHSRALSTPHKAKSRLASTHCEATNLMCRVKRSAIRFAKADERQPGLSARARLSKHFAFPTLAKTRSVDRDGTNDCL